MICTAYQEITFKEKSILIFINSNAVHMNIKIDFCVFAAKNSDIDLQVPYPRNVS